MDSGYQRFRAQNDRAIQESEARLREQRQSSDRERRHREQIAALKSNSPTGLKQRTSSNPPSLRSIAFLLAGGVCLFAIAAVSGQLAGDSSDRVPMTSYERESAGGFTEEERNSSEVASDSYADETPSREEEVMTPAQVQRGAPAGLTQFPSDDVLRGPTLAALDTGNTIGWKSSRGIEGSVSVSAPVEIASGICRTVVTRVAGSSAEGERSEVWCGGNQSEWIKKR
jgi:hypothetical protein